MNDNQRYQYLTRGSPPCKDCAERFLACSDRCPKDARGEYGYRAWKADLERIKQNRNEFIETNQEIQRKLKWGDKDVKRKNG